MIEETPEIEYTLLYIGTKKELSTEYKYIIPKNVKAIQEIYLFDNDLIDTREPKILGLSHDKIELLKNSILFERDGDLQNFYRVFFQNKKTRVDPSDLFFSREIWDILIEKYEREFDYDTAPSFIDYFYNWRFSNLPIFKILSVDIPRATIYHSLCTGYAGLLGCVAKINRHGSFILTEHGIYTNERKIEVSQSEWIYSNKNDFTARNKLSYFKQWWLNKFYRLGQLSYEYADQITTLYEGNKYKQIDLGADISKISIIANGISESKLKWNIDEDQLYQKKKKYTVALIGRVVPIKDIKTFIKAVAVTVQEITDVEFLILGPTDEDPDYYSDCQLLVSQLGLSEYIHFLGKVNLKYYYPSIDLIILSSISEGQPLVILEGFSFSIPAITTDVGSCSELIHGSTPEDKALGSAGYVVPFGMSDKLGKHIMEMLKNDVRREEYGKSAYQRFKKLYQEKYSIQNYKDMYQSYFLDEM